MLSGQGQGNSTLTGTKFEYKTDLFSNILQAAYPIDDFTVRLNGVVVYNYPKHDFYCFLTKYGLYNWKDFTSTRQLPDEALVLPEQKKVFIIEKKFQQGQGSVDKKILACDYEKRQYNKMLTSIGFVGDFSFVFNDWFKKEKYASWREYIYSTGWKIHWNQFPIEDIK